MNLATLQQAKQYLALTTTNQDALIEQLLARATSAIEQQLSRRFPSQTITAKRLNGTGTGRLMLPARPVTGVTYLKVATIELSESDGLLPGYLWDDKMLYLQGYCFPQGYQNVIASWTAGYAAEATLTVPAPTGNATTSTLVPVEGGYAVEDRGVTYTDTGAALTLVDSAPTQAGEYSFGFGADGTGTYTFFTNASAGDTDREVTMAYYYIPPALQQACIEMVGLKIQQRDKIGVTSKSLAGESISFSQADMTTSVRNMIAPFALVAPA